MAILTQTEIVEQRSKGFIQIEPFNIANLNPNSYDLTLFNELQIYKHSPLDPKNVDTFETRTIIIPEDGLLLEAGKCYLARTNEYTITEQYVPTLHGKSGIGRMFLSVAATAGYGDIGFAGYWTLQLIPSIDIIVYPNMKICQIQYETTEGLIRHKYTGSYQNSDFIVPSRIYNDFGGGGRNNKTIKWDKDGTIKKKLDKITKEKDVIVTPPESEVAMISKKYGSKKSKTNKKLSSNN